MLKLLATNVTAVYQNLHVWKCLCSTFFFQDSGDKKKKRFWRQCSIELQLLEIQNKSAFWCFLCNLSFLNTLRIISLLLIFGDFIKIWLPFFASYCVRSSDVNSSLLRIFLFHLYFFPLYFQFSLSGNIICWIWDLLGWSSNFLIFLLFSIFVLLFSKPSSNYF